MILSPATWPSPSRESMALALALRCLTCLLSRVKRMPRVTLSRALMSW